MKMKVIAMLAALSLTASAAAAQELPRKVNNVEVLDLDGKPAKLPYWGEKNLMIFYVDRRNRCPLVFTAPIKTGKPGKLQERQRQRNVGCRCPHSATGQKFTKRPNCCKHPILQKGVPSCKIGVFIIFFILPRIHADFQHGIVNDFANSRTVRAFTDSNEKVHFLEKKDAHENHQQHYREAG